MTRLAREDPGFYEKVASGEPGAKQAAIKAGFRARRASIPACEGGEPLLGQAAKSLAGHFDGHLDELIDELRRYS